MGRKVKTFFHVLTGSIVPQTSYYAKVLRSRMGFSALFFLAILFFTSLAILTVVGLRMNGNNPARMQACIHSSLDRIPDNYILHIREGILSTNQEMPLFVWFSCDDRIQLLAVVDERAGQGEVFSYGAQLLLTGTDAVARYRTYTKSFSFGSYLTNLDLDKKTIVEYADRALEVLGYYVPIVAFSLLLVTPLSVYLLNIFYVLASSLSVYIFYSLFGKKYTFRKILQVGLHSSSLPLLSSVLFVIFPVNIWNTLFLYFSLIFIFQLVAVYEAHYVEPHEHHPSHRLGSLHK